jgi:Phosphotransferase enzyme family
MVQALVRFPPLRRAVRYVRRRIGRERIQRIEGPPTALSFDTLDALCRERGRGGLKRCAHLHLSGWKSRGTYRLELDTETGTRWQVIFKDECYRPELIPALQGLPVSPGPPEAMLYRLRTAALARFLPQLLWFREIEPGCHFQYLLEDLAETHAILRPETADHIDATRGLLLIHKVLRGAFDAKYPDGLIRYDRRYSERLLDYALGNLADYRARTADVAVAALLARWRQVAQVHQRDEYYDDNLRVPIHGDYNNSNIHARLDNPSQLKVVDWEWGGVGLPHADLAALVKTVRREDHLMLLQLFVEEDRQLEPEQHQRLFHWCQLERRLLDAAFLARQQLVSARRVPWLQAEITRSARDVLAAVEWLDAASDRRAAP